MNHQQNNFAVLALLAIIFMITGPGCDLALAKGATGPSKGGGAASNANLDNQVKALKASFAAKNYKDVLTKCDAVFKIDKKNMTAYYYKGLAHQALGEYLAAEGQFLLVSKYGSAADKPAANKALAALAKVKRKPTVLDFYTDWCGPCKILAPYVKEAEDKYGAKVAFERLDGMTPGVRMLMPLYKIDGYPILVLLDRKKKEVDRLEGLQSRETVISAVAELAK